MPAPVLTLTNTPVSEISNVAGKNVSAASFVSDADLEQWEARAGAGTAHGAGLLVGSGGELAANTAASFDVQNSELTDGEGTYKISVWGKGWDGYWNDGTRDQPKTALPLMDKAGAVFKASGSRYFVVNSGAYGRGFVSAYTGAQIDSFIGQVI